MSIQKRTSWGETTPYNGEGQALKAPAEWANRPEVQHIGFEIYKQMTKAQLQVAKVCYATQNLDEMIPLIQRDAIQVLTTIRGQQRAEERTPELQADIDFYTEGLINIYGFRSHEIARKFGEAMDKLSSGDIPAYVAPTPPPVIDVFPQQPEKRIGFFRSVARALFGD